MAVTNKIFIPTFISSINYEPVRTLPHVYFYNGLKECEEYFIQHYPSGSTNSVQVDSLTSFPYLDYYDGLTPSTGSNSLLFFNELPAYGETPTASLFTEYWSTYVSLLYNPRTRLFNASAIIPLADYFEMELNDIVQWRGNYYHLRAINQYNLKDGTCQIELLGPIIRDAVSDIPQPEPPVTNCTFNFSSSVQPAVTTTTTAAPTTTTTTASPTIQCTAYVVGTRTGESFFFTFFNCFTNSNQTVSINSNNRSFSFCGNPVSAVPPYGYLNITGPCNAPAPTTTTTTTTIAPPTTTTTTTTLPPVPCAPCILYEIDDSSSPTTYNATYTDCNGVRNKNISGTSGAPRFFTALSGSLVYSGTRAIFNRGVVADAFAGSVCKTLDYCKFQTVTLQDKGGMQFVYIDFIPTASCSPTGIIEGPTQGGQITIISGSLATDPSVVASFGAVQIGGPCCTTTSTTTTTTMAP